MRLPIPCMYGKGAYIITGNNHFAPGRKFKHVTTGNYRYTQRNTLKNCQLNVWCTRIAKLRNTNTETTQQSFGGSNSHPQSSCTPAITVDVLQPPKTRPLSAAREAWVLWKSRSISCVADFGCRVILTSHPPLTERWALSSQLLCTNASP